MNQDDKLMDHLESQIPEMAKVAFKKAYWEHLSSGRSVMVQEGNDIVIVHPDGTREFKKKAPPMTEVNQKKFSI